MTTSNLFRPPPPPPPPTAKRPDPLIALSKPELVAPEPPAPEPTPPTRVEPEPEPLTDLTDEDMELWAVGGTRIIQKPAVSTPAPAPGPVTTEPEPAAIAATMKSIPVQTQYQPLSYPPIAMTPSIPPAPRKSNVGVWLLVAGLTGLFGLAIVAAGVGYFYFRARDAATELATTVAAEESKSSSDTTVQAQPAPTATSVTTSTTSTATTSTAQAQAKATPAPVRTTETSRRVASSTSTTGTTATTPVTTDTSTSTGTGSGTGAIRTFAAGAGKAVFVDGHLVGIGAGPLKTACGRHSVAVGEGKARMYDIPCSGSAITVGTPDGG